VSPKTSLEAVTKRKVSAGNRNLIIKPVA